MKELSVKDTMALKGVALLLLLIHHLFYVQKGLYDDFCLGGWGLVHHLGKASKVCVAIFVFLSGYGLMAGAIKKRKIPLAQFYGTRFVKLLLNFWLIYLVFVSIGVCCFSFDFWTVYEHNPIAPLVDFMGLSYAFYGHTHTMNVTWWFYSLIIFLYLLFPFFFKSYRTKNGTYAIVVCSLLLGLFPFSLGFWGGVKGYLLPFVMGSVYKQIERKATPAVSKHLPLLVLSAVILFLIRPLISSKHTFIDDTLVCMLMCFIFAHIALPAWCSRTLQFLGKHSFNIFLFHTFIYYYWFPDLIYASRNPLLIFFALLGSTLFISICLERIKEGIGFYRFQHYLIDKITYSTNTGKP